MNPNLNDFKEAAERLRVLLSGRAGSPAVLVDVSQLQALDLLAKAHGFADFDDARRHLETESARSASKARPTISSRPAPYVMAIVGGSGCGKTTLSKEVIAQALSAGMPVRILGYREYFEFESVPGARIFAGAGEEDFYAAWGSAAPLVIGVCTSQEARELDFTRMSLSSDALFVCDEATDFAPNLRPLGGTTILVARFLQGFPISPSVYFSYSPSMGGWQTIVPREHLGRCVADLALQGSRGTAAL